MSQELDEDINIEITDEKLYEIFSEDIDKIKPIIQKKMS